MPIYEQAYRRYEAREPLRQWRSWPITREGLRLILAKRAFLLLLILSFLPALGFALYVYGVTRLPQAQAIAPIDGSLFALLYRFQLWLMLIVTTFAGAGLVANDLRTGAILVYLSRPLTRLDYVLGKLGVLMALNLAVTLGPGLFVYGAAVALVPELTSKLVWIAPAVVAYSLVLSLVASLVALAVSSLSKSARLAGLGFFVLMAALDFVVFVIAQIYDLKAVGLLSIRADLAAVGQALLGVVDPDALPWAYPLLVLIAVGLGAAAVLRSRVRAVEIVT